MVTLELLRFSPFSAGEGVLAEVDKDKTSSNAAVSESSPAILIMIAQAPNASHAYNYIRTLYCNTIKYIIHTRLLPWL